MYEIDKETAKFSVKNIIRFINREFEKTGSEMNKSLGHFITEYSNLSSFVHGGMRSYKEITAADSKTKRIKEYARISALSFQMSNSIKLFSLLIIMQTNRDTFQSHYLNIDRLIKKINEI